MYLHQLTEMKIPPHNLYHRHRALGLAFLQDPQIKGLEKRHLRGPGHHNLDNMRVGVRASEELEHALLVWVP